MRLLRGYELCTPTDEQELSMNRSFYEVKIMQSPDPQWDEMITGFTLRPKGFFGVFHNFASLLLPLSQILQNMLLPINSELAKIYKKKKKNSKCICLCTVLNQVIQSVCREDTLHLDYSVDSVLF